MSESPVKPAFRPRTAEEARRWLYENGLSIAEFARNHQVKRMTVVDLLRGKRKGLRGDAHNAAVALGMKQGVVRRVRTRPRRT